MESKSDESAIPAQDLQPHVKEALRSIQSDIDRTIANAPEDPIERLFWFEFWMRTAAKRYAKSCEEESSVLQSKRM
jgi:hypothetical protein